MRVLGGFHTQGNSLCPLWRPEDYKSSPGLAQCPPVSVLLIALNSILEGSFTFAPSQRGCTGMSTVT